MICHMPFLIGAGQSPPEKLDEAALALANAWGGAFMRVSTSENPQKILQTLPNNEGLVQLFGDGAITQPNGGSWLEALGAWRKPSILMVLHSLSGGDLPGLAAAYVALCKVLSVPLIGIVQVGGSWDPELRRMDGLPWCGWIPDNGEKDLLVGNDFLKKHESSLDEVVFHLRRRLFRVQLL